MAHLPKTLRALHSPDVESVLRLELEQLDARELPLQQGLTRGSHVGDDPFRVVAIGVSDDEACVRAKIGVFYMGIIAGCSCADDPTPVEGLQEYCELLVEIDKESAEANVTLLSE
jgi:hypothetical protein